MKKIILLFTLFAVQNGFTQTLPSSFPNLQPEVETFEILISDKDIELNLKLDESTVRCLVGDYGASSLKISVAELKHYAAFRHTTWGETEPCINAGFCGDTPMGSNFPDLVPEKIIDPLNLFERSKLNIKLVERVSLNPIDHTCFRRIQETVKSTVRGVLFQHVDGVDLGFFDYDVCLKLLDLKMI